LQQLSAPGDGPHPAFFPRVIPAPPQIILIV
jgi:hypothetical protein